MITKNVTQTDVENCRKIAAGLNLDTSLYKDEEIASLIGFYEGTYRGKDLAFAVLRDIKDSVKR